MYLPHFWWDYGFKSDIGICELRANYITLTLLFRKVNNFCSWFKLTEMFFWIYLFLNSRFPQISIISLLCTLKHLERRRENPSCNLNSRREKQICSQNSWLEQPANLTNETQNSHTLKPVRIPVNNSFYVPRNRGSA